MDNLLSVPEFANAVGKKKQGIYIQTKNEKSKIYPYVVKKGNTVFIKKEAIEEVYGIGQESQAQSQESQAKSQESQAKSQIDGQESQAQSQENQTPSGQESQAESQDSQSQEAPNAEASNSNDVIAILKAQLEIKDKQIEHLQKLLDQEQQLHARATHLLMEYKEQAEAGADKQGQKDLDIKETSEEPQKPQEPKRKKSIWQLLFGIE